MNTICPLPHARPGTFRKDAMNTTTGASPEDLRNRLVDAIVKEDISGLRDARVETAMRTVPRHAFLPDTPFEEAYANKSVTIKENPDEDALPLSCASQPDVVHFMLVQLAVREGDNVFEIGAAPATTPPCSSTSPGSPDRSPHATSTPT